MKKSTNTALWILSGVLAGVFFAVGGAMFIGRMDPTFLAWGYTEGSPAMIGILELLGAIGLVFVRTAGWSALGLIVVMVGAVWTLAVHGQYLAMIAPLLAIVALALVVWGRGLTWTTRAPREPGSREVTTP